MGRGGGGVEVARHEAGAFTCLDFSRSFLSRNIDASRTRCARLFCVPPVKPLLVALCMQGELGGAESTMWAKLPCTKKWP